MQNLAIKQQGLEPEDLPDGSASRFAATYLRTMEAGGLETAKKMLGPGFSLTFPGDRRYSDLESRIADAQLRYRNVRKVFEIFDELETPDGTVVYSIGTLTGEWLDGSSFSGIRYIDRFLVSDSKFIDMRVWNDMSEYKSFL